MLKVKGEESKKLYSGVKQEGIYNPEGVHYKKCQMLLKKKLLKEVLKNL